MTPQSGRLLAALLVAAIAVGPLALSAPAAASNGTMPERDATSLVHRSGEPTPPPSARSTRPSEKVVILGVGAGALLLFTLFAGGVLARRRAAAEDAAARSRNPSAAVRAEQFGDRTGG